MALRGIRGAITADSNNKEEIINRTREMLEELISKNGINTPDIASAIFSVTEDLNAEFPAVAARQIGWTYTPLFCAKEIDVPGSLKNCIRVLIHVNSDKPQEDMVHAYLRDAERLRPDIKIQTKQRLTDFAID
jgi:chorismate mutase